jgi:hypothetical protein
LAEKPAMILTTERALARLRQPFIQRLRECSRMAKIHCVHRSANAIGPAIFIHGVTGEPQESLKAVDSDDDPLWPKWLEGDFPDPSVFAFDFPLKKDEMKQSLYAESN